MWLVIIALILFYSYLYYDSTYILKTTPVTILCKLMRFMMLCQLKIDVITIPTTNIFSHLDRGLIERVGSRELRVFCFLFTILYCLQLAFNILE